MMIEGWANWDEPLNGQEVYFDVEHFPDCKVSTMELRRLLEEAGEDGLTPGHAKKKTVRLCLESCEASCEDDSHHEAVEVWAYTPRMRRLTMPSPARVMRCPTCRLLCMTSGRTGKTYIHQAWRGHRLGTCPGSKQPALDPETTKPASH